MARFDRGEVLLTTRIGNVGLGVFEIQVPRDTSIRQLASHGIVIQFRHASGLAKAKPSFAVIAARQLDFHVPLALTRFQRERAKRLLVDFKRNGHAERLAALAKADKTGSGSTVAIRVAIAPLSVVNAAALP